MAQQPEPAAPASQADENLTRLVTAYDKYVEPHLKLYAGLLILILIVVLGLRLQNQRQEAHQAEGWQRLERAEAPAALEVLAQDYEGTLIAESALFQAASLHFAEEEFERTRELFQRLVDTYPESMHVSRALLGIAYSYEGEDQFQKAMQAFSKAAEATQEAHLKAEALVGAGRCAQLLEKTDQARTWYENAVAAGDDTSYGNHAETVLKALAAGYRTVPPPAPPETKEDAGEAGAAESALEADAETVATQGSSPTSPAPPTPVTPPPTPPTPAPTPAE